jgi:hypothetical protein
MKKALLSLIVILSFTACAPKSNPTPEANSPTELIPTIVNTINPVKPEQKVETETEVPIRPYQPELKDDQMEIGKAWADDVSIQKSADNPAVPELVINGSLPTPCNKLRIVASASDSDGRILVDLYSVRQPDVICAQMIESFSATLPLKTMKAGDYSVFINGDDKLHFTWPL